MIISFNGHRSAVTCLAFNKSGVRLASGGKDTDIIIWDLIAETGLFKLRSHKDQITGIVFALPASAGTSDTDDMIMSEGTVDSEFLLSTSKDSLIKLWDLTSQHCIETHVAQTNGECWAMDMAPDGWGCATAGIDGEIKIWSLDAGALKESATRVSGDSEQRILRERGVLYKHSKDRISGIAFHPREDYFAVHGSEKAVELWRMRSEGEIRKSLARKRKRRREKAAASESNKGTDEVNIADGDERPEDAASAEVGEVFVPYVIVRTGGKVKSIDWVHSKARKEMQLLVATANNVLEVYTIPLKAKAERTKSEDPPDYNRIHSVDLPGHRTDIRALSLSSDDRMIASASSGDLKIWNTRTRNCIRTLECGYALSCSFLPGDKIVVVGTKTGQLELFDIASSAKIESVEAHGGPVWTLEVHPEGKSVVTGSADKTAKFWKFEIIQEEIPGSKRTVPRLTLVHSRTLKVNDDILSLRFSPDSRLLAVATLDNTVKVLFVDSLKLFLNLYGHKLPVLNMSISFDNKLIATCSADKNIRLWGLDFGDCHKAFFAHNDSIMQVAFVPHPISKGDGHQFFSASKDRTVKSWDGDKFEQIQKLEGHHGEIWAMAVSRTGDFVVTASHDKSIRVWSQTDEPIFLEEERERELEALYESTLTTTLEADADPDERDGAEVAAASKQTIATLTAGERIMEALELGIPDLQLVSEWTAAKVTNPNTAPPARNPLFLALGNVSAERYVLDVFSKIPAAQLQDALLVLPFSALPSLFSFIGIWVRRHWSTQLVCRVLFFMLRTHQRQIVASRELKVVLESMRKDLRKTLAEQKDIMGFNLAALRYMSDKVREESVKTLEDAEDVSAGVEGSGRKRAFVDVA